jgi:wobble nucleotide-excising tRNase
MATNKTKAQLESEVKDKSKEIRDLKKSISNVEQQMEEMRNMVSQFNQSANTTTSTNAKGKIDADEEIAVISLTPNMVYLTTEGMGQGEVFEFEKYGDIIDIPMGDLKALVSHNKSFFQQGVVFIQNEAAVKQLRLKKYYETILSDDVLSNILEQPSAKVIEIYKMASKAQQENIVKMITEKKYNHQSVDANVLKEIGDLCGRNLIDLENPMDITIE